MKKSHCFTVTSLGEFFDVLSIIGEEQPSVGVPLWFRGATFSNYDLLPTCYRDQDFRSNPQKTYTEMSLQEDMIYQNFRSQVNHLVETDPQSGIEWNEVFQHHFGQTRMLDWSESAQTALNFALEPFIHPDDKAEWIEKCHTATPIVWVLSPARLNEIVYGFFCDDRHIRYIDKALKEFGMPIVFSDKLRREMDDNKEVYFGHVGSGGKSTNITIQGILSLCVLEKMYNRNMPRLKEMLEDLGFNPFFYLAVRYYSDMLPVSVRDREDLLPPLAIVQPYHSERIRNQRGTFTVFPNYVLEGMGATQKRAGQDPRRMELQKLCEDCVYKIRILQPEIVARDMIYGGTRYTQLYPDLDSFAKTMVMKHYRV